MSEGNKNQALKQEQNEWQKLTAIQNVIFNLDEGNVVTSANSLIKEFDNNLSYSTNLIVCQIIHTLATLKDYKADLYLNFMKEIETYEENNKIESRIFDVFENYLLDNESQISYYLLEKMFEQKNLDPKILQNTYPNPYFAHRIPFEKILELKHNSFANEIIKNYEELSKNDWELHKKLIEEGINTNEIAKIIRNDEIEKLRKITTQTNFDFNQEVTPSLYERNDVINNHDISLIDYAAYFGSINCFKYLMINGSNLKNTGKYAILGENEEIIHLCEQNYSTFEGAYKTAIEFHKNDLFHYLYDNK